MIEYVKIWTLAILIEDFISNNTKWNNIVHLLIQYYVLLTSVSLKTINPELNQAKTKYEIISNEHIHKYNEHLKLRILSYVYK